MTSPLLALAVWITRMWTRTYTWGMDPLERDSRRQEIESDLWESQHDPPSPLQGFGAAGPHTPLQGFGEARSSSDARMAGHVIARLVGGVLDDVRWRAEHPSLRSVRALVAIGTTGLLAAALWVLFLAQTGAVPVVPPPPPAPPLVDRFSVPPPPPPPPPPPCVRCPTPSITVHEELHVPGAPR